MQQYSLVILKNYDLLHSIKDYFYQSLLQYGFESTITCEQNEIDSILDKITTSHAVVIQEGMFFNDNFDAPTNNDCDLIGHILDRKDEYYELHQQHFIINIQKWKDIGSPSFIKRESESLIEIERANENFHDDYTPVSINKGKGTLSKNKLRFGAYVISEFLKYDLSVRPFDTNERQTKNFVYYEEVEQVNALLQYQKNLYHSPYSYYYPVETSVKKKTSGSNFSNYISVANGVESLYRLKDVYKDIKTITYYDMSMTALIFTELLLKYYKENYKDFVIKFDNVYGAKEFNILTTDKLDNYTHPHEILPILEHIRNNVKVKYCYGDITRTSILENLKEDTIINVSNSFEFKFNIVRDDEISYWYSKIKKLNVKTDVLH